MNNNNKYDKCSQLYNVDDNKLDSCEGKVAHEPKH
jgi:hypothetical protein